MVVEELQIVKLYYQTDRFTLYEGDCRSVLPIFAECSVDSVVCDPPYELGFMGKGWDRSGIAYDVSVWRECLRVLKPGGHLLAFGGSRTYHRLACAIEDAGFEIRDQIQWIYGSGFPKSLDVSKAIDARPNVNGRRVEIKKFLEIAIRQSGKTQAAINVECGFTASSFARWSETARPDPWRYVLPNWDQWQRMKSVIGFSDEYDEAIERAERETIGQSQNGIAGGTGRLAGQEGAWGFNQSFDLTSASSEAAKQWNGWGTALKPAHEPIVLARKPLIGTVAENVLQHGPGGLNIEGCRIESESRDLIVSNRRNGNNTYGDGLCGSLNAGATNLGRWPANVIHDGSDDVLAVFPDTAASHDGPPIQRSVNHFGGGARSEGQRMADFGSAARFFYCAKATQDDRNEGLDDLPIQSAGAVTDRKDGSAGLNSPRAGAGRTGGSRNNHPTVKPTDLMRYLCRLITPPGGLVLDPFCGSGSTGKAAMLEGLRFVGIELSADYCQLAQRRIEAVTKQGQLFT